MARSKIVQGCLSIYDFWQHFVSLPKKKNKLLEDVHVHVPSLAVTSGRRAQNASSEWNGQKRNIIVNL